MTRHRWLAALLALATVPAAAVEPALLRFEDDVAALDAACAAGDRRACGRAGLRFADHRGRLRAGGEARWRLEHVTAPAFGAEPNDRWGTWLRRYSGFLDVDWETRWRVFAQLHAASASGRAGGAAPLDADALDVQNAFLEWRTAPAAPRGLGLRVGVQELRLGSARLVDVREGPNVRRTFVGGRGTLHAAGWQLEALALRPRRDGTGAFDEGADRDRRLRGFYLTAPDDAPLPGRLEVYALRLDDADARYARGAARERRDSLGLRAAGDAAGFDWNAEAVQQRGRFGASRIDAWTAAVIFGWRAAPEARRWRLGLAVASGDRGRGDLGTFNPLFPRGNYFGEDALLGPRNLVALQAGVSGSPRADLALDAGLGAFWRHTREDGIYRPGGGLLRAPDARGARHVATGLSATATWTPAPGWELGVSAAWLVPGDYIADTGPARALRFLEFTARRRY